MNLVTFFALFMRAILRSRCDLALENMVLRQQLDVLKAKRPRPQLRTGDRILWVLLKRLWPNWRDALIIVQPETVLRWHRGGFRRYWRWKSRRNRGGPPTVDIQIRNLIRRMADENPTRGSPRVHSEIRMLGFDVSERTVTR